MPNSKIYHELVVSKRNLREGKVNKISISLVIIFASAILAASEIFLHSKYAQFGRLQIIITSNSTPLQMPTFTRGYIDTVSAQINEQIALHAPDCRSFTIAISTHGDRVYHEFESYCSGNPLLGGGQGVSFVDFLVQVVSIENSLSIVELSSSQFYPPAQSLDTSIRYMAIFFVVLFWACFPWPLFCNKT